MRVRTRTVVVLTALCSLAAGFAFAEDAAATQRGLSTGEVIATVMACLLSVAFAAWAKRLDKALDLLEKIQASMHKQSLRTERRLTRLEQIAAQWGNHVASEVDDDGE